MAVTSIPTQAAVGQPRWWQRQSVREGVWRGFVHGFLILVALVLVLPLY